MLEAVRQQRDAAALIRADGTTIRACQRRIAAACAGRACGEALLLHGDPGELPRLLAEQAGDFLRRRRQLQPTVGVHPGGSADLIVVTLPAPLLLGRRQDNDRLFQARLSASELLAACQVVLRPGGYLVAVSSGGERAAGGRDLGSRTVSVCTELGLRYWQHIVCLLVPIEGGELKPPPRHRRRAQAGLARVVHQDVHVFRKPEQAAANQSTGGVCR